MNVLMLNYEYPPLGGGAGNATYYLLHEFGKRDDIAVDLVTSSAKGRYEEEHPSDNITIYKLPIQKKSIHYWTMREILSYSIKVHAFVKKRGTHKFDLAHAFFGIPCGIITWINRKQMPYIISMRGSDVPGFNERFSLQYVFLSPFIRHIWRKAHAVVANSAGLRDLAHRTDPLLNIHLIPNGIDTHEFMFRQDRNDGRIVILTVARLIRRKGIDDLLRALPDIIMQQPGVSVRIIGEGNMEKELRTLALNLGIKDHVEFLGYIPHDKLPEYYATSDIFVLPSRNEGMSNTVLEAMACGLPIITTDTGGTNELIRDNGQVIPVGHPDAIASAIHRYLNDRNLRYTHGSRSRLLAESMDWKQIADEYIKLYRGVY
jgi:glycosyltransferase involved in cell wall biosynthesis